MGFFNKKGNWIDYPAKQPKVKTLTGAISKSVGFSGVGGTVRNNEHVQNSELFIDAKGRRVYYSNDPYKAKEWIVNINPNSPNYGIPIVNRYKTDFLREPEYRKFVRVEELPFGNVQNSKH